MHKPTSTYRLQFSSKFTFEHASAIIDYLSKLGITHVYASPVFQARSLSTHGYDVVNPREINRELGGKEAFDALLQKCYDAGIGWIQDIVPNHMALSSENPFLVDVFENGPLSRYYSFFDIDWNHPYESLRGKVVIPVLGSNFGKCLEQGELELKFDESGLYVSYYDHRFPLRMESYATVFGRSTAALRDALGDENHDLLKFLGVLYTVKNLPDKDEIRERYEQIGFVKTLFWEMYSKNSQIKTHCNRLLADCNGDNFLSDKWSLLESVLLEQYFRLTYWKTATEELNYRRFFTVNDLIAVRVEDDTVFELTHALLFDYVLSGRIQGLRIDHIDGLYDPFKYCARLRQRAPDTYIVVEKILIKSEELRTSWPIQGTTGYDFLNIVNQLFCNKGGQKAIDKVYTQLSQDERPYARLVTEKKRLIIGRHMAGDIDNLALMLKKCAVRDRRGIDITMYGLRRALVELLTFFPVYRTYVTESHMDSLDRIILKKSLNDARSAQDEYVTELNYIEAFLGLDDERTNEPDFADKRRFIMRLQQFTGPLLAKGIEDTALYTYNRLVSLNEVGGDPEIFGIDSKAFHVFCSQRAKKWPDTMNATATHDTKRGEGTRSRINVLSELGIDWSQKIRKWHLLNKRVFTEIKKRDIRPVMNDEYLFYQTLVGSFPFEPVDINAYRKRIEEYMIKAVREAKEHSSWIRPNEAYENALLRFVQVALSDDPNNLFLSDFIPFQRMISWYGMLNSLAQTTLKITAPGIPDFYQGTELWDFSLVDPDNRSPVNFNEREAALREIISRENDPTYIEELFSHPQDGRVKMFLTRKMLFLRQRLQPVFEKGQYIPLKVKGTYHNSVVTFIRKSSENIVIVVVPRMLTRIIKENQIPLGRDVWGDTYINIPAEYAGKTWAHCFYKSQIAIENNTVLLGDILEAFPVAILECKG